VSTTDELLDLATEGLSVIAQLTSNVVDDNAVLVIKAVRAVIEAFESHKAGAVSYTDVLDEYAKLAKSLEANDTAADAKLKDKFPST